MKTATSALTSDKLDLQPASITAEEATELRRNASRGGWKMPVSQLERDLYAEKGLQPPD